MNQPLDERDILTHCALRFDGCAYLEQTGFDHQQALEEFLRTGEWRFSPSEAMATLFALQRFLCKGGGVYYGEASRHWKAYRELFLRVAGEDVPDNYRGPFFDQWETEYAPDLAQVIALVQQVHENTDYEPSTGET